MPLLILKNSFLASAIRAFCSIAAIIALSISACGDSPEVAAPVSDVPAESRQENDAELVNRARGIHDRSNHNRHARRHQYR